MTDGPTKATLRAIIEAAVEGAIKDATTIEHFWGIYAVSTTRADETRAAYLEREAAFYAGAGATLELFHRIAVSGEEEGMRRLDAMNQEMKDFLKRRGM